MLNSIKKILPSSFRDRHRLTWRKIEKYFLTCKLTSRLFRQPWPHLENGQIYLHLGCGPINHAGFINIDAVPAPHIHDVRQIDDLSLFKEDTVDLIYASHCLEHFGHRKVPEVLREWYRVLKTGGILRLSVPDFDLLLNIYKDNGNDINAIIQLLMGGQDYEYNFHKVVFTKTSLASLLRSIGFIEIRTWEPGTSELTTFDDWSARKIMIKDKKYPVSLNLEATK
jgi:predicted SAM-dependent methyltransferase